GRGRSDPRTGPPQLSPHGRAVRRGARRIGERFRPGGLILCRILRASEADAEHLRFVGKVLQWSDWDRLDNIVVLSPDLVADRAGAQDPARRREGLDPRGDVDRIAMPATHRGDQDIARMYPDAKLQPTRERQVTIKDA